MAFGIEILEKYISTCVSCVNNRDGLCGFINDGCRNEEPEHISLGEYEMMSSEEIDLLHTRNQGIPCSRQLTEEQLLDRLENILEGYDTTPAETEVKRIITQCYKLVNKARRNDGSLDGDFDRAVEQGVNVILSYLDLRFLEGGKDISDLLAMYPFGYYRKTGLYRYCPEELAALYLSEIQQSKDKTSGTVEAPEPQLPAFIDNDSSEMSLSEFNKLDIHDKFSVVIDKMVCNLKKIIHILSDEAQSDYIDEIHSLDTLVH